MTAVGVGDTFDQYGGATQYILDYNQFNPPPASGYEFFVAFVSLRYEGPGSNSFSSDLLVNAVGDSNVGYTQFGNSCGVTPPDFDVPSSDVFSGGEISGFVCYEVLSSDADSMLLYYEPLSIFDAQQVFFALE